MKNGNYNDIEEKLQKRFKGVKDDIKDPGSVKIEYKEKEKKESFFSRPAVYAAGLALVAVLVCSGTFIGLKVLERIGANNIASSSTQSEAEFSETAADKSDVTEKTEDNKGYYPVYLKITCGNKSEYLPSYIIWESVNDGETENITQTSITSKDYEDMDNIPVFDIKDFEIGYGCVYADGMEATVKYRMAGRDGTFDIGDIGGILSNSDPGVYRFIAVADFKSVSDGVTREGCYEYPFDINYEYAQSSDSAQETEPDDVPVSFGIGSGNLFHMFNPVLHSVITDAGTEIVETGEPGNGWTVVIKGRENFGFVFSSGVDFISATADKDGVILFETDIQADAESKMLQLWDSGETDFTVTVYMSKHTESETRIYRGAFRPVFEEADETTENTEEPVSNIGDYNGDFFVTVGDVRIHPDAYMLWENEHNDKTGETVRKEGQGGNGKLANVLKVVYKDSLGVGYTGGKSTGIHKGETTEITYRYADKNGMSYDDMRAYLDGSGSGTYRIVAVVTYSVTSNDITYSGCYEFPFDVEVLRPEVTTVPEETTGPEETTDITPPGTYKEGKPPVYLKVFDANENIYPDAYESYSWYTEGAKNVPVLHYDGSDIDIAYVQPSGRCYVGYRLYGSDEEEHISVDYINDYLKHAHTGNYRFIVIFSIEIGDEIIGYDYPFDVEVLIKEETTVPEETTGPEETPDLTVKVTCGAKTINPDAYAAYGGGVDEDPAYMSNKVPYITYVNDGLKIEYDERNIANVSYWIAFSDKKSWTLDEINDYLKDAVEGEYRIVIRIKRETHDEYGNFINSTYDYPFDVIVTTPAEPIEPDMTNGKYPVYLTVKCGDQTIYPDAYGLWTTQYDDKTGSWIEGDGAGAEWAETMPKIEFDGSAAIKIGYKEAGNVTELSFRIDKGKEFWSVSFNEINSFFKHAEPGTYRVIVTCEVKGRLIEGQYDTPDGRYESTGWEYPFDVVVK